MQEALPEYPEAQRKQRCGAGFVESFCQAGRTFFNKQENCWLVLHFHAQMLRSDMLPGIRAAVRGEFFRRKKRF